MLQSHRADNSAPQDIIPPDFSSPAEFVKYALAFLRRRAPIILMTGFLSLVLAALYLVTATPTFTATAQLIVDAKAPSSDTASVTTAVESQIAILRSDGVARATIEKLGLADDREFSAGALHRLSQTTSRLLGWSRPETGGNITRDAVEAFARKLTVKRAGLTYIVDLAFNSVDPDRAAEILGTVVETYVTTQMDAKYKWGLQNEKWVKDRVNELSNQAATAKRAVTEYNGARNGVAAPAGIASSQSKDELRELEATADAAARTYDNFLRMLRYMDAMQQQSAPVFETRLLTGVSHPYTASSPNARLVIAIAILGGALLGIGIGLLRDWSDRARAPARWSAGTASGGGTAVLQGPKGSSGRPHFDGSFKVDKGHAYKEANPDL
ncbi:Wzz/FepE/Etk N-terminal domain-containing protein [Bradyrhizobium pachyrhizi]|uniref:Wzz/FepE/Etk N-terminal domain-containing protein n=1 Tax=Bradyrhizobium pachyrhizi TaxID=280333 RepID=UPI0012FCA39B|nr:Wzz/FepE/Etk N-terminal domain-containing protein [Bradyrhizobium pachyrhizi]WFU56484.1 Wzz/FepE/Etk N-terminal domain-containing protein [Bradyrhizobium pachyrhizi]